MHKGVETDMDAVTVDKIDISELINNYNRAATFAEDTKHWQRHFRYNFKYMVRKEFNQLYEHAAAVIRPDKYAFILAYSDGTKILVPDHGCIEILQEKYVCQ